MSTLVGLDVTRVVFESENGVTTRSSVEHLPLGPDQALIRTRFSCISAGTELAKLSGLQKISYPWVPGNRAIGRIVETGAAVHGLKIGDLVFSHTVHASLSPSNGLLMRIPDALDHAWASTLGMAMVAMVGVQTAEPTLGDQAVVLGGGLVGQYTAQLLELAGVETILVDRIPGRLELAARCGVSRTVRARADAGERTEIMDLTHGRGAEMVIDCTGVPAVIERAAAYAAKSASVVLSGSPRGVHRADLSEFLNHVHLWREHGNLTIRGAHEWKLPTHRNDFVKHSMERNLEILTRLALSGKLRCQELTNRVYDPARAAEAYHELQRDSDAVVGAVFDWTGIRSDQ